MEAPYPWEAKSWRVEPRGAADARRGLPQGCLGSETVTKSENPLRFDLLPGIRLLKIRDDRFCCRFRDLLGRNFFGKFHLLRLGLRNFFIRNDRLRRGWWRHHFFSYQFGNALRQLGNCRPFEYR